MTDLQNISSSAPMCQLIMLFYYCVSYLFFYYVFFISCNQYVFYCYLIASDFHHCRKFFLLLSNVRSICTARRSAQFHFLMLRVGPTSVRVRYSIQHIALSLTGRFLIGTLFKFNPDDFPFHNGIFNTGPNQFDNHIKLILLTKNDIVSKQNLQKNSQFYE